MSALAISPETARRLTDEVKRDAVALWDRLVGLHEGRAHEVLGYASWGDYCSTEFDIGKSRAYQLLDAGRTRSTIVESGLPAPTTEAAARELAPLRDEPEKVREVWAETVERHGDKPTAAQVRAVVRQAEPHMPPREKDEKGRPLDVHYVHADSADLGLRVIAFRQLVVQADRLLEPRDRNELQVSVDLIKHSLNDVEQILRPAGLRIVDGGQS